MGGNTGRIFEMPEERLRAKDDNLLLALVVVVLCLAMALLTAVVIANAQGPQKAMADEGFWTDHSDIPGGIPEEAIEAEPEPEPVLEPEPVQELVEEPAWDPGYSESHAYEEASYSPEDLQYLGVVYDGGHRYTWYSENVLPGGGLDIPGRHTTGEGFVRDGDGYICLASSDYGKGTAVDTPFGPGKVYDCGCASGTLDVYVSW